MSDVTAWISRESLVEILNHAKSFENLETGGLLIGYWARPYVEVVITHVTIAGPNAEHGKYSFTPDPEYDQKRIESIYNQTTGLSTYLGDWHSHPHGSTKMSNLDKRTLRRISRTASARTPHPIMGIVGGFEEQHVAVHCLNHLHIFGVSLLPLFQHAKMKIF